MYDIGDASHLFGSEVSSLNKGMYTYIQVVIS